MAHLLPHWLLIKVNYSYKRRIHFFKVCNLISVIWSLERKCISSVTKISRVLLVHCCSAKSSVHKKMWTYSTLLCQWIGYEFCKRRMLTVDTATVSCGFYRRLCKPIQLHHYMKVNNNQFPYQAAFLVYFYYVYIFILPPWAQTYSLE